MRVAVLVVALAFTGFLVALTVTDIARNGVTFLDLPAVGVVVLFATGIVGALLDRRQR